MKMRNIVRVSFVSLVVMLSGCASMLNGTEDTIAINSLEKGTTLQVNNVPVGKDATSWVVKRGESSVIKASKEGCKDTVIQTGKKFDKTSLLGILIDFGIITIPVDLMTGGAWKTSPSTYVVSPVCEKEQTI